MVNAGTTRLAPKRRRQGRMTQKGRGRFSMAKNRAAARAHCAGADLHVRRLAEDAQGSFETRDFVRRLS